MKVRELIEMLSKLDPEIEVRTNVTETDFLQDFSVPQDAEAYDLMKGGQYPWAEAIAFDDIDTEEALARGYQKVYILGTST